MMTDRLALLREEIQAEIAMRQRTIDAEAMQIDVLERVLIRMNRIESEHPADAAPPPAADTGRAPRRDLRAEITALMAADTVCGHTVHDLARSLGNTESATKRALDATIRKGLITEVAGLYFPRAEQAPLAEAAQ